MRHLLLLASCLAACALLVHADQEADEDHDIVDAFEGIPDDADVDLARMLEDLFVVDEEENEDGELVAREGRARGRQEDSDVESSNTKDLARYNSFMDTFYRRLNSYARSKFDPLSVGLVKKDNKKKGGKKGKADVNDDEEGDKKKKKKKKGKKSKKGGKNGNKKGKKGKSRHPKDLDLEEVEVEEEVEDVQEVAAEHEIQKREVAAEEQGLEVEEEEDSLNRVSRDTDDAHHHIEEAVEEAMAEDESVARKGKPSAARREKNRQKKEKKEAKKDKKKEKASKKKEKAKKKPSVRTSRASVEGVATLQRVGDVIVKDHKGGKEIRGQFKMGPVSLKVSRKFGAGKDVVVRDAEAVSPEITGKIAIQVTANGEARVSKFLVNKPSIVQTTGTLAKSDKRKRNKNTFLENSIGRHFTPIVSKKLKQGSRHVLKAGEPKNN